MKNKEGFTLVEILAVIVLISLIVIIAIPSVKSISAKSKRKLFDTKVRIAEEALNMWAQPNKSCFEVEDGCNVLSNCYLEGNIYTCETTFGKLAEQGIINYDDEYNHVGYVVNPIDSGSMNDFKLIVTLDNNNKMVNTDFDDASVKYVPIDRDKTTQSVSSSGNISNKTVKYTVVYWLQNVGAGTEKNSINYTKKLTEEKEGISGQNVTPEVSSFEGFNSPAAQTVSVKSDGSTVINYYYTRKSFTVTLNKGTGISSVSGAGTYQYGQSVTINATVSSGYIWNKWTGTHSMTSQEFTFKMPSYNVLDTANAKNSPIVAQAIYSADDKSLTFIRDILYNVGDTYNGKTVSAVYTDFEDTYNYPSWHSISTNIEKVYVDDVIKPKSTANWFQDFENCSYFDLTNLDSSFVKHMNSMFSHAGYNAKTFKIVGLDNWDTSKVTDMHNMFYYAGYSATEWDIGDLSAWNTSNVTNISSMFADAGYSATEWDIGDLGKWDTANVTDMSDMFVNAGRSATKWDIGDLSKWNTSNVTDMTMLFSSAGYNAKTFKIVGLDKWDTSKVTDMKGMFQYAGHNSTECYIDVSKWDTSKVTDMHYMFLRTGYNAKTFKIVGLDNWDTSKVTNMYGMFDNAGYNATTWDIGNLRNWDTSKVTNMGYMFYYAGYKASYLLNLSNWNVRNVTSYNNFNSSVSSKVIAPSFGTSA